MKPKLLLAIVLLSGLQLAAMDGFYFMDLIVKPSDGKLTLNWQPQRLISYEQFKDDRYTFSGWSENSFDNYIQSAIVLMKELDGRRDEIKIKKYHHLTSLVFGFTLRQTDGKELETISFFASFYLTDTPGQGLVILNKDMKYNLDLATIEEKGAYQGFLKLLGTPLKSMALPMPSSERFMVECYYRPSEMEMTLAKTLKLSEPAKAANRSLFMANNYSQQEHLGTTFCEVKNGRLPQVRSGHLHFLKQATELYAGILEKEAAGEDYITDIEAYLEMVPTDLRALELLIDGYMARGQHQFALNYINRNRPIVSASEKIMDRLDELVAARDREREKMLSQRKNFKRANSVEMEILSPQPGDWVGGNARMEFDMRGHTAPILRMDVMLEDKVLGSSYEPPFSVPFRVPDDRGRAYLRLVTWFKDKTYQDQNITIKPIFVADESRVNLATLRVSAVSGPDYLLHLRSKDFVISEKNDRREITNFRRDKAPLRVAILIDTSLSMQGENLYRAQTAVNTFLSKLRPADRASIYTFDQNVMKLAHLTDKFESMQSVMLTLSPHHSTTLHDALAQANLDLAATDGNQVIIVVSDGRDSASNLNKENLYSFFSRTSTMVYSIILKLQQSENREGKEFLTKLSKMTGSAAMEVESVSNLSESFGKIYDELRSFYLMDFYSSQSDFKLNSVQVKVRKPGVQTRFSRQRTDAVWQ